MKTSRHSETVSCYKAPSEGLIEPDFALDRNSGVSHIAAAAHWTSADAGPDAEAAQPRSSQRAGFLGEDSNMVLRYLYAAAWLAVLFAGYGLQHAWCACGIPYDCLQQVDYLVVFNDLCKIGLLGAALAWFVRLADTKRFAWLFSWRRWYVWAVYVALPPIYSAFSNLPFARHSLASTSDWGPGMIVVVSAVLALALCALSFHLYLAKRGHSWWHLAAYVMGRGLVYAFVAASAAVLTGSNTATMHVHHLYLGWALAIWAEFDHWASGLLLAVGSAVLVQGAGAYSIEPIFTSSMCITTRPVDYISCAFWDRQARPSFRINFCIEAAGPRPAAACHLRNGSVA